MPRFKYRYKWSPANDKWYWHKMNRNGKITADGAQGYASEAGVRRAIRQDNAGSGGPLVMVKVGVGAKKK